MSPTRSSSSSSAVIATSDRLIEGTGAAPLGVRVYGRRKPNTTMPLVLHFHGGAFVSGGLDEGAPIAGLLAEAGALVVSLDYPLAPAHPFPQAIDAGYAALDWVYRNRNKLAGPGAQVWLAGEEAGGNLAAAVALIARDRRHPPLAGQILLSPMLDPCVATASLREADAGPVGCRWADGWRQYLANAADAVHPYAAPGSSLRLAELPRSLLITAQDDPLRDEVKKFSKRLCDAGVKAELSLLAGPTGWPCICADSTQCGQAPWVPEVRERVRQFLQNNTSESSAKTSTPVSSTSSRSPA